MFFAFCWACCDCSHSCTMLHSVQFCSKLMTLRPAWATVNTVAWWQRQKSIRWLLKRLFHVCQVDSTCPMLQLAQAVILRFLLHIKGKSARTCLTFSHLAPCQHFPPDCQMPVWALQVGPCHIPLGPNFPPELLSKDGRHHLLFSKSLIRFDASDIALKHLQLCIATSDAFVLASNKVPIVGGVGAG